MRRAIATTLALALGACAATPVPNSPESHYYPSAATTGGAANPWLVLLPGGGGIEVFGDTDFYFDVAREWNAAGFDVLVVHYQAAAPLLGVDQLPPPLLEKAVVADALAAARRNGWLDLQCPGFAMGFSFGGAGTLALAADPPANMVGAIGFYPMVAGQPQGYRAEVPVLVLQGSEDELTTLQALEGFLVGVSARDKFTVEVYPGAQHGFDIPSLDPPVEYNGGTFEYHARSAADATAKVAAFRSARLAEAAAPAECKTAQDD